MSTSNGASVLGWDLSQLGDEEYFAHLVGFSGSANMPRLAVTRALELPPQIYFTGNFSKLKSLDFPYNSVHWPLMSEKMLAILKNLGHIPIREIPVTMLDDTVSEPELLMKSGADPNHVLHGFSGVQLLEHLDVLDRDRSEYEPSAVVPSRISNIRKLALKDPPGGFPPLFRLSAYPALLFVSHQARSALEAAKIRGAEFTDVGDYPRERASPSSTSSTR